MLGSSLQNIGNKAFLKCNNVILIQCESIACPELGADVFSDVESNIPVYVPCGAMQNYLDDADWCRFSNIRETAFENEIIVYSNDVNLGTASMEKLPDCNGNNEVVVVANPTEGRFFENWTENGIVVSTDARYSFNLEYSRTLVANFKGGIGVVENAEMDLMVYPNPVEDQVVVNGKELRRIEVYSVTGKSLLIESADIGNSVILDLRHLPNGIYFLRIENSENVLSRKIIKK